MHKKSQHKHIKSIGERLVVEETSFNSRNLFRINPLAIESESVLLGYYTLANEWQDGVLTTMLRKANRVGRRLCFRNKSERDDVSFEI